jgi:hypothetical protein
MTKSKGGHRGEKGSTYQKLKTKDFLRKRQRIKTGDKEECVLH